MSVLLVLGAIFYFIFTAEQDNLGVMVKYLSALAAGIPLIMKLLSRTVPSESK